MQRTPALERGDWRRSHRHSNGERWRRQKFFLLILIVAGLAALPSPVSAETIEDPEGGGGGGPSTEAAFVAPANGFTWAMRDRFGPLHNGIVDYHWNQAAPEALRWGSSDGDREKYDPAFVHPASFEVNLNACPSQAELDASLLQPPQSANTYQWVIAGHALAPVRSCLLRHHFASQGPYFVRLTVSGPDAGGPFDQLIVVRDHLIVSLGDSYASGEGNPDVNRSGTTPARWVDKRCHRSAHAGPAQAALALERADPHSSVTFLSFACSGATINRVYHSYSDACPGDNPKNDTYKADMFDPYKPGDPQRPNGSGVLGSYRGVEVATCTNFDDHVPAQLEQLAATVGDRRVDALVISAGGNDLGFGPLAATCVIAPDCLNHEVTGVDGTKVKLPTRFGADVSVIDERYLALKQEIDAARQPSGAPLRIASTFITEYPDPLTDLPDPKTNIAPYCDAVLDDILWPFRIEKQEVTWARDSVLAGLNRAVRDAAGLHGWQYVDGIDEGYYGHGYCVGDPDKADARRFIRTATESAQIQGPDDKGKTSGTLHPTAAGHAVYAARLLDGIEPALAALPVDDRIPPAAPTAALSSPINASNQAAAVVSGVGEPGTAATITVTDTTGTPALSATVPAGWDGGYRATFDLTSFSDGAVTASVVLADVAGNTSPAATATATKDSRAPVITATTTPTPVNGWHNTDVDVTLTATDVAGIREVVYSAAGATTIAATTVPGGQASFRISPEGDTTITYSATDNSGNTEPAKSLVVRIDRTVPTASIDTGAEPHIFSTPARPVTGTATDNLSGVAAIEVRFVHASGTVTTLPATCTAGCGTTAATWSVSTSGLKAGAYTVTASASDVASNTGPGSAEARVVVSHAEGSR